MQSGGTPSQTPPLANISTQGPRVGGRLNSSGDTSNHVTGTAHSPDVACHRPTVTSITRSRTQKAVQPALATTHRRAGTITYSRSMGGPTCASPMAATNGRAHSAGRIRHGGHLHRGRRACWLLLDPEAGPAFRTLEFNATACPPAPLLCLAGGSIVRDGYRSTATIAGSRRETLPPSTHSPGQHQNLCLTTGVGFGHSHHDLRHHFIDRQF